MQLVEQGKLDLDADVNTYLTQFKIPATYEAPITLRHALTHTVGLEDGGIGYLMARSPQQIVPLARSLADHMPARVRPVGTSGEGLSSSYSNWATSLAGLIVANVSGVSFEDYVEANILRPLGMDSSTFKEPLPEALEKRMSVGYSVRGGRVQAEGLRVHRELRPRRLAGRHRHRHGPLHDRPPAGGGAGQTARILKPETAPRHARARLQPPPRRGRIRPRLLRDVRERPAAHRARRGHELLPQRARAARGGGRRVLRLRQHGRQGGPRAPALRPCLHEPLLPGAAARGQAPRRLRRAGREVRRTLPRAPPFLHPLREGLRACWEGPPSPRPRTNTLVIPGSARGQSPSTSEVAPAVFREVDGDRTVAFIEDGAGQVVGMVGQFAFIPFYKLRWYEGSPFHFTLLGLSLLLLPDRPGLGAAALEERQGGAASRALGPAQPRRCSEPSTWPSSWPSRRSSPRAWTTSIFAVPKGLYAVLTLPLIGLAAHRAGRGPGRAGLAGEATGRAASRLLPHRGSGGGDRLRVVPELLEPPRLPDRIERAGGITSASARGAPWLGLSSSRPGASSYQRGPERYSFSVCRRRARARLGAISAQARTMAFRSAMGAT